jgi:CBS domain-containing protein
MKKCADVMTKNPAACLPTDMAVKAAGLMKSENVGSIPVIESEQSKVLVGIVTDRDLVLKIVAEGLEDELQKALDSMSENQVRRIPIVDQENKILGIISQADVATRAKHPKRTAKMVMEISQVKDLAVDK